MVKRNSNTRAPRRSSGRTIGLELMMDCQNEDLSPAQLQYMKKCRLEFDNAMAMIKAAQAKARAGKATVSVQKVHMKNIPPPKTMGTPLNQQKQAQRSTSPDVIFVGESPPPPTQKTTQKTVTPAPQPQPPPLSKPPVISNNMQTSASMMTNVQSGAPQYILRGSNLGNNMQGPLRLVPISSVNQYHQRPPVPVQFQVPKQNVTNAVATSRNSQSTAMSAASMLVNSAIMAKRHLEGTQDSAGPAKKKLKKPGDVVDTIGSWVPLDEYYYGKMEGDPSYVEEKGEYRFKCWYCSKMLYNNIKAMMHIQGHIDSGKQHNLDLSDLTQCKHCYKQFDTPFEMQTHVEKVHMNGANVLLCRICERDHESRNALTHHMRQNHNACEMPYICHLCSFRSSMYSDVVDHFKKKHDSSPHILCLYCLKVFKVKFVTLGWGQTQTYYGHLLKHQSKASTKKCTLCRLTFYNVPDVKAHKKKDHQANHKGVLGPNNRYSTPGQVMIKVPESGLQPKPQSVKSLNAPAVSKVLDFGGTRFPTVVNYLTCLECKMSMGTPDHFKKYIECSMCRFATSCSIAYANHMMGFHSCQVSSLNLNIPWERRMESPMYCLCGFGSRYGNKIANHLVYCTKRTCYMAKPDLPMSEEGGDDMDPRRKPGASILDVLGLVKKRTVTPKEEITHEVIKRSSWEDPPAFTSMKTEVPDVVDPTPAPSQKTETEEIPPELTGSQKWTTVKIKDSAVPSKTSVFLGVEDIKMAEEEDEDMDVSLSDEMKATLQNIVDDNINETILDTKNTDVDTTEADTLQSENVSAEADTLQSESVTTEAVTLQSESVTTEADTLQSESVTTEADKLQSESVTTEAVTLQSESVTTEAVTLQSESVTTEAVTLQSESVTTEAVTLQSESVTDAEMLNSENVSNSAGKLDDIVKNTSESGVISPGVTDESEKSPDSLLEDACLRDVTENNQDDSKHLSESGAEDSESYVKNKSNDDVDNLDDDEINELLKDDVEKSERVTSKDKMEVECDSLDKERELLGDSQTKGDNSERDSNVASSSQKEERNAASEGSWNQDQLKSKTEDTSSTVDQDVAESEFENTTEKHMEESSEDIQKASVNSMDNDSVDSKVEDTEVLPLPEVIQQPEQESEIKDREETSTMEQMETNERSDETENKDLLEDKMEEQSTDSFKKSEDINGLSSKGDNSSSDSKGDNSSSDYKGDSSPNKGDHLSSDAKGDNSLDKGDNLSSEEKRNSSQSSRESSCAEGREDHSKGDRKVNDSGDHYRQHSRDRERYDKDRSRNRDSRYDDRASRSDYHDNRSQGNHRSYGDHHGDRSHDPNRDWDRNHSRSHKEDRNWRHSDNRNYHGNQDHHSYQGHRDNRSYHGNSQYSRDGRDDRRQGSYHDNYQSNRNHGSFRGGRGGYGNRGGYQGNYR
ncbi:uncharacterized protein LOC132555873 isoform X2 [Ylistrum balloti]|uniref:uncharacterized protein LOC132555873 isoform X2 n=1 Tax=Ylistrum balloti TaxID=509963 RepID=UPI002905A16A|nr:uncharacterized protein LOC132555873 isoform X2 [Ylistrum balloti]